LTLGQQYVALELDADVASEVVTKPAPSSPSIETADRTGWTWEEYGDDWTCDDDCRACATGARCEDCQDCTQFAAPYPPHWATLEREGGPARMLDICHGPGGMAEGRRLALADGGDASAEVDAVGVEINSGAAATATAAGHRVIVADVRTLDPRHPVLRRVRKIHFSTPCPTFSKGGKHSGVQPAEVSAFMDVLFYASEALGWLEVDDVCSHYGGPHGYFGGEDLDDWDPADYDGEIVYTKCGQISTEHCASGYVPATCTPDEYRELACEAVSDERTALMAEVLLWPMAMIRNGGILETVTMEQSDNLLKRAPGLCEAMQEELKSVGFAWVSFQIEDAADYGAASNRVRAWMVASRHDMPEGAQWGTGEEQATKVWGKKRPTWAPDLSTWVDLYGGRAPLPRVTMAQALGWDEGWWIDTRGARPVDPITGRAKGGGSFSADKVAQCVTATWYGATRRRADEPQGCASGGRAFTQAELGALVGFRWDYPWQHVGRGEGIRTRAQQAADAVSPFMGMAVTGAVFSRARRKWYRRAMAYQRALYRYAFEVWTNDQRAAVQDRLDAADAGSADSPRSEDVGMPSEQTPSMLERGRHGNFRHRGRPLATPPGARAGRAPPTAAAIVLWRPDPAAPPARTSPYDGSHG
jgi:site-specific DNA-cytosine methylase